MTDQLGQPEQGLSETDKLKSTLILARWYVEKYEAADVSEAADQGYLLSDIDLLTGRRDE